MNIAVLIPCYNEEAAIRKVVTDFQQYLPDADIYVYDNNSSDNTVLEATAAGAIVRHEFLQGKGNVVRRMLTEIESDIYVMVDGDDTYQADCVQEMIDLVECGKADMVCGDRLTNGSYARENKRKFHNIGNNLVKNTINFLFKSNIRDIMTGYRVFNRKFVKNFPVQSEGFEIETEMTLHALDKRFSIKEIPIVYKDRSGGGVSKLNTFSDGIKVLKTIFSLFKDYKPLLFFGYLGLIVCFVGLLSGFPVIYEYLTQKKIYHVPLAILAAALEMLALNLTTCGFILDTIAKNDKKNFELRLIDSKGEEK